MTSFHVEKFTTSMRQLRAVVANFSHEQEVELLLTPVFFERSDCREKILQLRALSGELP